MSSHLTLLRPYLPHALVPPLAYLSLGFRPSPLLVPILLSLLLHLVTHPSPTSSGPFLTPALLIALLTPGIALSFYTEVYSALGSKVETLVGLGLLGVVYATALAGVLGGWGWAAGGGGRSSGRGDRVRTSRVVQAVGFPVVWTVGWGLLGWVGPLGRMVS